MFKERKVLTATHDFIPTFFNSKKKSITLSLEELEIGFKILP